MTRLVYGYVTVTTTGNHEEFTLRLPWRYTTVTMAGYYGESFHGCTIVTSGLPPAVTMIHPLAINDTVTTALRPGYALSIRKHGNRIVTGCLLPNGIPG